VPSYPEAAPAIQTDIVLYSSDLAAYIETGLVVRSIFEPTTQTMKVQVLAETVPTPRVIAERTIFTAARSAPVMTPEEAEAEYRKVEA
jgi:hypothetical protein